MSRSVSGQFTTNRTVCSSVDVRKFRRYIPATRFRVENDTVYLPGSFLSSCKQLISRPVRSVTERRMLCVTVTENSTVAVELTGSGYNLIYVEVPGGLVT